MNRLYSCIAPLDTSFLLVSIGWTPLRYNSAEIHKEAVRMKNSDEKVAGRAGVCYNIAGIIPSLIRRGSAVKLQDAVGLILMRKGSAVHSVSPDATVYEALEKMADSNIGALVVMQGTDLVGLI